MAESGFNLPCLGGTQPVDRVVYNTPFLNENYQMPDDDTTLQSLIHQIPYETQVEEK
jgi:hypothetical protein